MVLDTEDKFVEHFVQGVHGLCSNVPSLEWF